MVTRSDSGFGAGAIAMGLLVLILLVAVLLLWGSPLRGGTTTDGAGGSTAPNPASSLGSWVPSGPGPGYVLTRAS